MMLVATFGKIPRFLLFRRSRSVSSSSPVLGEATAPSRPSPVRCGKGEVSLCNYCKLTMFVYFPGLVQVHVWV